MRSGAHLEPSAQQQGHDSDNAPLGALESERDRRARRRSKRKVAPSRAEGVGHGLANGERGASGGAALLVATGEAEPTEVVETTDADTPAPAARFANLRINLEDSEGTKTHNSKTHFPHMT